MKQLLKTDKSGIMKLPDKGNVDFGEMIIKEDLFKKGIDPKAITSETQLDSILNAPHVPTKPKKTGEVIDVDFGNIHTHVFKRLFYLFNAYFNIKTASFWNSYF